MACHLGQRCVAMYSPLPGCRDGAHGCIWLLCTIVVKVLQHCCRLWWLSRRTRPVWTHRMSWTKTMGWVGTQAVHKDACPAPLDVVVCQLVLLLAGLHAWERVLLTCVAGNGVALGRHLIVSACVAGLQRDLQVGRSFWDIFMGLGTNWDAAVEQNAESINAGQAFSVDVTRCHGSGKVLHTVVFR